MAVQYISIPVTSVTGTSGSEQTLFTASASGTEKLFLWVNNTDSAARDITVNLVPNGGSVATTNEAVTEVSVGATSEPTLLFNDMMVAAASTVQLAASTTATLTVFGYRKIVT